MNNHNRAFWKALHSLTHPLSIAAVLLLLFNDHWLRHTYPSWLTGKLGDFTWLLFAPFIAALLFAWLLPHKSDKQVRIIGILSITFIGLWFALAKTVPFFHWLTTETLYTIVGYRGSLRMDVTDLLTLPALLLTWHIWQNARDSKLNLRPVAYAIFGLGLLGTMASDDPAYDLSAVQTICELENGHLLTSITTYNSSNYISVDNTYRSINGGIVWEREADTTPFAELIDTAETRCSELYVTNSQDPTNADVQYRWIQDEYVEKSIDGGETWARIHELAELDQDVREHGNQNPYYDPYGLASRYEPSPVAGLVHSSTGNLVLAMSTDGVLVITPDGNSYWSGVGEYMLDDLQDWKLINDAFDVQKFLVPTLWFLILVSTMVICHKPRLIAKVWLGAGWISWGFLVTTAHKVFEIYTDLHVIWGLVALASLLVIAAPMVIWALYRLLGYYPGAFRAILTTAMVSTLGYMLPMALWTQGTIPRYYMAAILALIITACVLASCYQYFTPNLPARRPEEKSKRKPKEA